MPQLMAENGNSRVHFSYLHIFPDEFTYSLDTSLAFKGLKKWDGEVPGPHVTDEKSLGHFTSST